MFTVSQVSISGFVVCAGVCSLDQAWLLAKVCRPQAAFGLQLGLNAQ